MLRITKVFTGNIYCLTVTNVVHLSRQVIQRSMFYKYS